MVALNAQIETTNTHSGHLRQEQRQKEEKVTQAMHELNGQKTTVSKTKGELQGLRSSGNNKLAAFGQWMPKLVQAVNSCRTFRKKPVGPLGAHVNMVEGCNEQLSRAVEGELGGLVTAFLCDNRCT